MFSLRRACRSYAAYLFVFAVTAFPAFAQDKAKPPIESTKNGFTVTITGGDDGKIQPIVKKLEKLFHECYPKLVKRFEHPKKPAARKVRLEFERGLKVPAFCVGSKIKVSIDWLEDHPQDIGLLTHELTHVVQAYPHGGPGWLVEGIADFTRELYGPEKQPGWSLPRRLTERDKYTDSYRTTARFLVWLDAKYPGAVDKIHRKLQNREFQISDFTEVTGKSVDSLWEDCRTSIDKKSKQ